MGEKRAGLQKMHAENQRAFQTDMQAFAKMQAELQKQLADSQQRVQLFGAAEAKTLHAVQKELQNVAKARSERLHVRAEAEKQHQENIRSLIMDPAKAAEQERQELAAFEKKRG